MLYRAKAIHSEGHKEKNNVNYTPMFIVATKRCYTEPVLKEGHKELGGNRIRTADLNWPKQYFVPYDIMWKD